jgi:hypothetical protein
MSVRPSAVSSASRCRTPGTPLYLSLIYPHPPSLNSLLPSFFHALSLAHARQIPRETTHDTKSHPDGSPRALREFLQATPAFSNSSEAIFSFCHICPLALAHFRDRRHGAQRNYPATNETSPPASGGFLQKAFGDHVILPPRLRHSPLWVLALHCPHSSCALILVQYYHRKLAQGALGCQQISRYMQGYHPSHPEFANGLLAVRSLSAAPHSASGGKCCQSPSGRRDAETCAGILAENCAQLTSRSPGWFSKLAVLCRDSRTLASIELSAAVADANLPSRARASSCGVRRRGSCCAPSGAATPIP